MDLLAERIVKEGLSVRSVEEIVLIGEDGEPRRKGNTRDMIFDVPTLIAYFSDFMTLQPGDLILTGTPDGVADSRVGDEIVTEIEGLGRLVNTIVGDAPAAS